MARGWPQQIARRRAGSANVYLLASGRARGHLDETSLLAGSEWLAVADMVGAAKGARITLAAAISESTALQCGKIETADVAEFIPEKNSFRGRVKLDEWAL